MSQKLSIVYATRNTVHRLPRKINREGIKIALISSQIGQQPGYTSRIAQFSVGNQGVGIAFAVGLGLDDPTLHFSVEAAWADDIDPNVAIGQVAGQHHAHAVDGTLACAIGNRRICRQSPRRRRRSIHDTFG